MAHLVLKAWATGSADWSAPPESCPECHPVVSQYPRPGSVRASRRVTGFARLAALEPAGINVGPPAKQRAKQPDLGFGWRAFAYFRPHKNRRIRTGTVSDSIPPLLRSHRCLLFRKQKETEQTEGKQRNSVSTSGLNQPRPLVSSVLGAVMAAIARSANHFERRIGSGAGHDGKLG